MTTSSSAIQTPESGRGSLLRVGDIARATGKTVRAIRLYEELGLLRPATRSSGGFRLYDSTAAERVRWIDSLHALGFSLQEMREVRQNWWSADQGPEAMTGLRELFLRKLTQTRDALKRHQELERELLDGLSYLEKCETCAEPGPVQACVNCQQDHGTAETPPLVAGIGASPENPRRAPRPAFVRVEEIDR